MEEGEWKSHGNADIIWKNMSKKVQKVAKTILGESKGCGRPDKETWWWNETVQEKTKHKKDFFKAIHLCNNAENWERYRLAKKETKKAVSEACNKAYEEFYKELGTKGGERKIYKITKNNGRKLRDLDYMRCIKNEEGKVLVTDGDIKDRWKSYFYKLFNDRGEGLYCDWEDLITREGDLNLSFYRRIQIGEVKEALKKMENGKTVGPDSIPIEVWKCLDEEGML